MNYEPINELSNVAVIVDSIMDNVALSKTNIPITTSLSYQNESIILTEEMKLGERFALRDIPAGDYLLQYGYPFARSKGITKGRKITRNNTIDEIPAISKTSGYSQLTAYEKNSEHSVRTFMGYQRSDGRCGTRNHIIVVPTSMCASAVAQQIAEQFQGEYPGIDGIIALPNTEGCGCAGGLQIERFLTILKNSIFHVNVACALIIDLGCEQTNYAVVSKYLGMEKHGEEDNVVGWLTIQREGGSVKTVSKGVEKIASWVRQLASTARKPCPIGALTIGSECGASDAFSGITANRLIGAAVDQVIAAGGAAIFSEFPEMVGAEQFLFPRIRDNIVREKFVRQMNWYREMAQRLGTSMDHNLVPENRNGGLINPYIKSLGAVMKGGTAGIEDVINYGERVKGKGLYIMQGPGNDLESVTGLAASGANIICFSTGRGTVTGCALVPVIKVSSTSTLYERMPDDIDFDAGPILTSSTPGTIITELRNSLLDKVIATASGCKTKPEINRQRQFQIWTAGKLSL
jgi:altronate hydrolase